MKMAYRTDIDGLRAIAVLAVVANHAGIALLDGGFVGVDIFFVISGYLISGIIVNEMRAGTFSARMFYERRVRRIAPAMLAVFLATTLLAYEYLLPSEIQGYASSLIAALLCISNIYFWGTSGYFDAIAAGKPLLHTWSLGVEEQFYIALPILLFLCMRYFRRHTTQCCIVLCLLSFIATLAGVVYWPDSTFYLLPTRAWELLLGTLIALGVAPALSSMRWNSIVVAFGLIAILFPMVYFSKAASYPGLVVIPACLGAAAIIATGMYSRTFVSKLLSLKPVVFIGLISYSLYLWHWPILVFHHLGFLPMDGMPVKLEKGLLVLVSLVVAALSWRYIERPFRQKTMRAATVYRFAAAGFVLCMGMAITIATTNGLAYRFSPEVVRLASYLDYDHASVSRENTCFLTKSVAASAYDRATCLQRDEKKKNVLILGDSHAAHLWYGLSQVYTHTNFLQATATGCKPLLVPRHEQRYCMALMDDILRDYLPTHKVDAVLIEAIWAEEDLPGLSATLDYAREHAIPVILLGPMLQYNDALPTLLAKAAMTGDPQLPSHNYREWIFALDKQMADLAKHKQVPYISPIATVCPNGNCVTLTENGVPLLYDYGHLTREGSEYFAAALARNRALPLH